VGETRAADALVAFELVAFGDELAAQGAAQLGGAFTDLPEADCLVKASPEAFLLGVLFTQGVPAERAWAGPYLLRERLGHLDLHALSAERDAVDEAVCRPPALHRFKHTMAGWISDAAQRLLECWDGDASRIWAPGSTAIEVTERLSQFRGIGRKKAAMTVEILTRHFGVQIAGLECGSVAYDTQVRRVFLRTGLVDRDTPAHIADAAARACPAAPGHLDLPAWLIGRQWCHPRRPECEECRLAGVCPRLTHRMVEGVGARRRPHAGAG
jgi:uncharacterized HhH-GPD family protein